jgi:phenylalanine-4-hydroxylase
LADTRERVPPHLRRFVVEQDYGAYTAVDHAVWRFVLLQMYDRLQRTAHPAYGRGLERTGMSVERIPRIADMDRCLSELGWGAVCVDGFIPPRAFQEFQALGILPIAAEMRRVEHLPYTPAPDIIHEAGGHAPILPDPEYAAFLRRIGECGVRAFASPRDGELYEAVRRLSVVKEQRDASPEQLTDAERVLADLTTPPAQASEAAQLARLYWWTVEYGLVGAPDDYKLYGAGLLSSLAESYFCHDPAVRKVALTRECMHVDYDITRPQPQLFVARDFAELGEVLEQACAGFAFRAGGLAGLRTACASGEVATIELDGGLQITGEVAEVIDDGAEPQLVRLRGACALGRRGQTLAGHGRAVYSSGLVVAFGPLAGGRAPAELSAESLRARPGSGGGGDAGLRLACASGLRLEGRLPQVLDAGVERGLLLADARVLRGEQPLWPALQSVPVLLVNGRVSSVRAGAEDGRYWPEADYPTIRAPSRRAHALPQRGLESLYERAEQRAPEDVAELHDALQRAHPDEWLLRWNLLELLTDRGLDAPRRGQLIAELWRLEERFERKNPIAMGLQYLGYRGDGSRLSRPAASG